MDPEDIPDHLRTIPSYLRYTGEDDDVSEEQETLAPPFTPAQLEYIENLLEKTIKRLGIALETGTSHDWYSSGIRIEVKLTYAGEDGSYTHDVLESSSDSFTFPSHRCERDY